MIRNNLSILMAQRHKKISLVAAETGISRSTLTSIANNSSKMIQLETINTLCRNLNISPTAFFSYLPLDVEVITSINELKLADGPVIFASTSAKVDVLLEKLDMDCFLKVDGSSESITHSLSVALEKKTATNLSKKSFINLKVSLSGQPSKDLYTQQAQLFQEFWGVTLTPEFRGDLENRLTDSIVQTLDNRITTEADAQLNRENFKSTNDYLFNLDELRSFVPLN